MEDLITRLQGEINTYGNKIALQQFAEIKKLILEKIEAETGMTDLKDRLSDVPTKKGRPPAAMVIAKKVAHITLRSAIPASETTEEKI